MSTWSNAMAAAIATCAVLLAVPATAVDGEILIDQARVNAGGITPGDSPGFPATLSRPGRYKLTGNLNVPAEKVGIEVTAHHVTIDLNGFTISSPPDHALVGVLASNANGLRVMNGTIVGFRQYGVGSYLGRGAVVEDVRLISNGAGPFSNGSGLYVETEARIRNNTVANNRYGIGVGSSEIGSISWSLTEQNLIASNIFDAITVFGEGALLLLGNAIVGNGGWTVQGTGDAMIGYGNNVMFGNGGLFTALSDQLHPNVCVPTCP
jgi:hypothetical protein